jgi:hypothetical protein
MLQTLAACAYMPVPVVGHGQGEWHDLLDIGPPISDAITVSVGPNDLGDGHLSGRKNRLISGIFLRLAIDKYVVDLDYTEDYG